MAKEGVPLGVPDPKFLDKYTDDQCADYILDYMWKLGKDKAFKRVLLRMVERDGIRDTVRGLIQNA